VPHFACSLLFFQLQVYVPMVLEVFSGWLEFRRVSRHCNDNRPFRKSITKYVNPLPCRLSKKIRMLRRGQLATIKAQQSIWSLMLLSSVQCFVDELETNLTMSRIRAPLPMNQVLLEMPWAINDLCRFWWKYFAAISEPRQGRGYGEGRGIFYLPRQFPIVRQPMPKLKKHNCIGKYFSHA